MEKFKFVLIVLSVSIFRNDLFNIVYLCTGCLSYSQVYLKNAIIVIIIIYYYIFDLLFLEKL